VKPKPSSGCRIRAEVSTTSTAITPAMSRDAEMAVRKCVDAIEFGLVLGLVVAHDVDGAEATRDLCDDATVELDTDDGDTGLILAISEVNVLISGAIVDAVDGTPYDETAAASLTNALIVAVTDIESYLD